MNKHLILPFLLILAAGMGVGSLHNAQVRGVLPGFFTPFGFMLIALTFVIFLTGFIVFRYYDKPGSIGWGVAAAAAAVGFALEAMNLIQTLLSAGSLSGWLFHEYLGVVAGTLMLVKILAERKRQ